jgi:hypothetical protein
MTSSHKFNPQEYWFYFDVDENTIALQCSAWSGLENYYINDELISSQRSWRRKGKHCFDYEDHHYCVQFHVSNMITGRVSCSLSRDGVDLGSEELAYFDGQKGVTQNLWRPLLPALVVGMLFGFVGGFAQAAYGFSLWKSTALIVALSLITLLIIFLIRRK